MTSVLLPCAGEKGLSAAASLDPLRARSQCRSLFTWPFTVAFQGLSSSQTRGQRCVRCTDCRTHGEKGSFPRGVLGHAAMLPNASCIHRWQKACVPPLHFGVDFTVPEREQACWVVSESKPFSCVMLVILTRGLEPGSLHESQLANQATVPLKPCCSLHEIVTCLVACSISVHQFALTPCSRTQSGQKKEPAS